MKARWCKSRRAIASLHGVYLSAVPSFMPLTRLNDSAFDAQLEGVYFGMWTGSTSVRCLVTHAALTDKSQGSGQAECLDVFHEYRSEIENLASAKYDAGKIKSDGLVVVDSPDLNPEQFQQGLA